MNPTRIWLLPLALVVAAGVVYLLLSADHALLPILSVFAPIALGVFGFAELELARGTRARLAGRPGTKPINPIAVARLAALGKASAIVGAPLAGIYAGVLVRVVSLDSTGGRHDLKVSIAGVVCSVLLALAGLALETTCRVKHPPGSGEK